MSEPQVESPSQADTVCQAYIKVFVALSVLTAVSYVAFLIFGQGSTSAGVIMAVAVVKAFLVAFIFMHLKWDWGRVYFIVIPVSVLGVMMMIVLMPDLVLGWHR